MNLKLAVLMFILIVLYLKYSAIMGEEKVFVTKQADQCAKNQFLEDF